VVDFDVLNSKYFGVPQNRERIFIVAIREDLIEAETFSEESTTGQTIVPKGKRRIGEWAKTFNFDWPEQAEVTTRLHDILESNVDEKYYLVEEKTAKLVAQLEKRESPQVLRPQRTEYGKAIRKKYEAGEIKESRHNMMELQPRKDGISNTLTTDEKENWLAEPRMRGHVDIKGNESIIRTYSTEGSSHSRTTMDGGHREPKIAVLGNVSTTRHNNENVHDKDGIPPTITARDYKGAKLGAEAQEWWGEQESVQDEWKTEACIRRKVKVLDMTDEQEELMAKWEKDAVIRKSTCSECGIIYDVDDGCLCEEEVRPVLTR